MAIRFQAFPTLVLVHLEAALLLEISHIGLVGRTCDSRAALSSANFPGVGPRSKPHDPGPTPDHRPATVEYTQSLTAHPGKNAAEQAP